MADRDKPRGSRPPAHTPAPTVAFTKTSGEPADSRIGNSLGQGKYKLVGILGRGGMGVVYEAEDQLLHRRVAIKLLPDALAEEPSAVQRFIREAQAAARLSHPNAVSILEVDQRDGFCYMVMELVRGGTAQDHLTSRGPFDWREATRIAADVCRALAAAHAAGLVHRDIKPANILRATDGTIKLADFGLAKFADFSMTSVTAAGKVVGTPQFMSPEQCQCRVLDARSDVYSLGATYFALLTGLPPFPSEAPMEVMFAHVSDPPPDPRSVKSAIPEPCAAIALHALAKDPAHRFAGAGEMLAALEAALAGRPWSAPATAGPAAGGETTSSAAAGPHDRWQHWLLASGVLLTLLAIIGLLWSGLATKSTVPPTGPTRPSTAPDGQVTPEQFQQLEAAFKDALFRKDPREMRDVLAQLESVRWPDSDVAKEKADYLRRAISFRDRIIEQGLPLEAAGKAQAVAVSPDGKWLAAGGAKGGRIWDLATGEPRPGPWTDQAVQAVAFSADGRWLAAGEEGLLRVLDLTQGKERSYHVSGLVRGVAFSTAGALLAALVQNPQASKTALHIWNVAEDRSLVTGEVHQGPAAAVAFLPDGSRVITAGEGGIIRFWYAKTIQTARPDLKVAAPIRGLTVLPNDGPDLVPPGRYLGVACDRGIQFWRFDTWVAEFKLHEDRKVACLTYSPSGRLWAAGFQDGPIALRNNFSKQLHGLPGHPGGTLAIAISPDNGILATGGADGVVRLWDVVRLHGK